MKKIFSGEYAVTKTGRIWSYPKVVGKNLRAYGKWLKMHPQSKGYLRVHINGKKRFVHRIVANAFLPVMPGRPQINHRNGVKTDNRLSNLEWCNASENHKHAYRIGTHKPRK